MVEEKFLLDANSFMTPYQNYYPFDFAPGFWEQMKPKLLCENVAIMDVAKAEVEKGGDELTDWLLSINDLSVLDRRDDEVVSKYGEVLNFLQNSPLYNDKALRIWSNINVADPWLIAAASAKGYTLITFEQGAGVITEKNPSGRPKIPDIAKYFDVRCENLFYFMRKMGIKWN